MVDSGVDVIILSASTQDEQFTDYKMHAANWTENQTYGIKMLNLDLGVRREFQLPFIDDKINKGAT